MASLFNLIALKTSGGQHAFSEWRVPRRHSSCLHTCQTHTHTHINTLHVHYAVVSHAHVKEPVSNRLVVGLYCICKVHTCEHRSATSLKHTPTVPHTDKPRLYTDMPGNMPYHPSISHSSLYISCSLTNTDIHTHTHSLPCRTTRQLSSICQCYS